MRLVTQLIGGLRAIFSRNRAESELDAELRHFFEASVQTKLADGMNRESAERAARLELGSPAAVKDWVHDVEWESRVESVWQDIRYAVRTLRRSPGFAVTATTTFAIGIGANLAVFSVVDATLLKPLPFRHADRLVDILEVHRAGTSQESVYSGMTRRRVEEWRAQRQVFDAIEVEQGARPMALANHLEPIRVAAVSPGLFPMLGVSPRIGRHLSADDSKDDQRVLLLSEGLWRRVFDGASDIVGREVVLDGKTRVVIGVMSADARSLGRVDAWLPLTDRVVPNTPGSAYVGVVARLREGLTIESAHSAVASAAVAIQRARPTKEPWTARVESIDPRGWLLGTQPIVLTAFGAVLFVFLTACTNIANLTLSRAAARERELAMRAALGASRARIARQLFVESIVIAGAGSAAAIAVAAALISLFPTFVPPNIITFPVHDPTLDLRVGVAGLIAACLATLLTGTFPALLASRTSHEQLSTGRAATTTPRQLAVRHLLIAAQVAFACVLLAAAGLMMNSLTRLITSHPGYEVAGLTTIHVTVPASISTPAAATSFWRDVLQLARATPGVVSATVGRVPPEEGAGSLTAEDTRDDPTSREGAALLVAGPGYFDVLGIPLRAGRAFTDADAVGAPPVAIVDEETARRFWPGESAIGKRVRYSPHVPWMTVVGVAGDVMTSRPSKGQRSFELYTPAWQTSSPQSVSLVVRSSDSRTPITEGLQKRIGEIYPSAEIRAPQIVRDLYGASLVEPRFTTLLLSAFALTALLTAAVGVYGLLSYAVSQRTAELGVRMALGATGGDVKRLVIASVAKPVLVGVGLGLLGAMAFSSVIVSKLYQVTPRDPSTLGIVAVVFLAIAFLAAYIPARRAARVDPLVALRAE